MIEDEYIQAIKLSTQVWIWLYKNPTNTKVSSPYWNKIESMSGSCPLCEYFINKVLGCKYCCLNKKRACNYKIMKTAFYHYWYYAKNKYKSIDMYKQKTSRAFIASKLRREYEKITGDKHTFRNSLKGEQLYERKL